MRTGTKRKEGRKEGRNMEKLIAGLYVRPPTAVRRCHLQMF
jgi:hypothetical protein